MRAPSKVFSSAALLSIPLALCIASLSAWAGSTWPFVAFNTSMILMVALAFVGQQSYAYTFLAGFLFLGFWLKLVVHLLADMHFIESTGLFDGLPKSWDSVALVVTVAALGVSGARAMHVVLASKAVTFHQPQNPLAPIFYSTHRRPLWLCALLFTVLLNILNAQFAFFQIGVNPRLVLPLHGNVAIGWLVNWGFAFVVALLAGWEMRHQAGKGSLGLIGIFLEALMASASALSRSSYLFHSIAGIFAWLSFWNRKKMVANWQKVTCVLIVFLVCFVASVWFVQDQRGKEYFAYYIEQQNTKKAQFILRKELSKQKKPQEFNVAKNLAGKPKAGVANADLDHKMEFSSAAKRTEEEVRKDYQKGMLLQIPWMTVSRWIGLEAVLAVSSSDEKGSSLFWDGIFEDPKKGVESIFQRISGGAYGRSDNFTFLTLAGTTAVLFYSGSLAVVAFAMFFICSVLLFIETWVARGTRNPFITSLAGVAMAYTVSQMTFPYLTAIFFIELIFTLFLLIMLERCLLLSAKKVSIDK